MEYTYRDDRYTTDYDAQIADLYANGFNAYQIWKAINKKLAKTTVYAKIKRINEKYERALHRSLAPEFD